MNVDELRELSSADLTERLDEVNEEFFNLRFQNATGQLENFAQIKLVKREIARINTIVHERELGIEIEPKPVKESKAKPKKERSRKAKADKDDKPDKSEKADKPVKAEKADENKADDDAGED
ncbi:MAG TPA: 50S ribosomal protein L29 [Actinomycetota bacterium]|nr:50S ribosomal protein L29 [Actinomycetota bacterium]